MARLQKEPLRMFRVNMRKARVLLGLQPFFDDLMTTGGQATYGFVQDLIFDVISNSKQLSKEDVLKRLEKTLATMRPKAETSNKKMKSVILKYKPQLATLVALYKNIKIARSRVLLQQSIVLAITAFEVFCQDITISAVRLNTFIEKRFYTEISKKLDYRNLVKAGYSGRKAMGLTVASTYSFYDANSLAKHFKQLTGEYANCIHKHESELQKIIAYRNLIVHQGGIVDHEFKRRTDYQGKIGKPITLSLKKTSEWLDSIENLATELDTEIRATKLGRYDAMQASTRKVK